MALMIFILLCASVTTAFLPAVLHLQMTKDRLHAVVTALICGLVSFVTLLYLSTLLLSLSGTSAAALTAVFLVSGILSWRALKAKQAWLNLKSPAFTEIMILVLSLAVFYPICSKLMFERGGGFWTGIINAYGDLGWHISNITTFAAGQPFLPENPIFAGERLIYPFLPNFFSAALYRLGIPLAETVVLPALLLIPVLIILFYYVLYDLTENRMAALMGIVLFILGGSTFGFYRIYTDFHASGKSLLDFFLSLPRDYSGTGNDQQGFVYINPVTSLLLPQRNFLFALPLAFVIAGLVTRLLRNFLVLREERLEPPLRNDIAGTGIETGDLSKHCSSGLSSDRLESNNLQLPLTPRIILLGCLVGMMPLFHAHTMIALLPIMAYLFFKLPRRFAALLLIVTAVIAAPEIAYYVSDRSLQSHLSWNFGWISKHSHKNFAMFWLKNTGLLLPLTCLGIYFVKDRLIRIFALAGTGLFVIANLIQFAVWEWDNYKVFLYWQLWTMPIVVLMLLKIWHLRWGKVLVGGFLILHTFSGSLDLFKTILPTAQTWTIWDADCRKAAELLEQHTNARATILHAPIHNAASALAGRIQYAGYTGHIWSHGRAYQEREQGIKDYLEGRIDQPPETSVDYVLLGPVEQSRYRLAPHPSWQKVFQSGRYTLYVVSH